MSENQRGQKGVCVLGKTSIYDDLESRNSGAELRPGNSHFFVILNSFVGQL